jgi:colanic acid/amylovoran biosynthesis glycosyltransferase
MKTDQRPKLIMVTSAPVVEVGDDLILDHKFVVGTRVHCEMWGGPVECIIRRGDNNIPFGGKYQRDDLGFKLNIINKDEEICREHIADGDVIYCSGDSHETLHLSDLCKDLEIDVIYSIEYTLKTRIKIALMDPGRNIVRRANSIVWNVKQELRRRNAFRLADGLQANGYPATVAYQKYNNNIMMYLDNRMKIDMYATTEEMKARAARLRSGEPIRLIHSGRLEPMKGSQDIVPIAKALRDRGIKFTLDVYGDGGLKEKIYSDIRDENLTQVKVHDPVDFETELVALNRTNADIFLSCHRQSDPSCTYIESMACGLPIAGYDNDMWLALQKESGGGWVTSMGDTDAFAGKIAYLANHPDEVVQCGEAAIAFARTRDFLTEFARRTEHLKEACN